jgi:hypothetical protein
MLVRAAALCASAGLILPAAASPAAGGFVFDGGTRAEHQVVVAALDASSFDWNVIPGPVVIHIVADGPSESIPGEVWLNSDLLHAGKFAWGVVQHELAHQVDYLVLDDAQRARLERLLGGRDWCYEEPRLPHAEHGCERFASTLAWAYWQSPSNCMKPMSPRDESAAMPPQRFRGLLESILRDAG